ncbi:single-stranded DNA-binding protein [Arthrobacter sp. NPDC055585]
MNDTITLRGFVATEVRTNTADSGLAVAGFRMCTTERRFDRETGLWLDGHTNWYSISMFRQLATNAGASIHKGDRVIVTGRLRVRQWATDSGRSGTSVDIDADAVGHDLMWGTANFRRSIAEKASLQGVQEAGSVPGSAQGHGLEDGVGMIGSDVDPETGELLGSTGDFTSSGGMADGGMADLEGGFADSPQTEPEPAAY